jgi:RNA polymerase subunit RPABC4/transcription elongation factor Spt4
MATYMQPCIHCGHLVDSGENHCPNCTSSHPFTLVCPQCRQSVTATQAVCPDCGRGLYIACPHCGGRTFAQEFCQLCNRPLTVTCPNKACRDRQFYQNTRCTACGRPIKATLPINPQER